MRTRFPPSPTGFLHVGALRTALYNYLIAKQAQGTFLLRIEDTDQERSVPGAVENILRSLDAAGIPPDEGVVLRDGRVAQEGSKGPYFQSERLPLYRRYADELLEKGHAYRCFCTLDRLGEMRKAQEARKRAPMYDRRCLELLEEEFQSKLTAKTPHVIRMKVPHERIIRFEDDIRGTLTFQAHTVDDQVLLKSDGFPTYHLAHVVDDHLMDIDLVLRGEEWLSSLPKHLLLFEFLEWKPPRYAHVPLLLNKDKTKLSKRQNSVAVEEYLAKGFLPEALLNFLALLGWNPGTTQELFSLQDLIEQFSLERVQKSGAFFDLEKLHWLQGQWMRRIPLLDFAARIRPIVEEKFSKAKDDDRFEEKAELIQERIAFFHEAPAMLSFFYEEPTITIELLVNEKQKVTRELIVPIMKLLMEILSEIPREDWKYQQIRDHLGRYHLQAPMKETAKKLELAFSENTALTVSKLQPCPYSKGQVLWVLRSSLTGLQFSPGAYEVAEVLGKEETLRRLDRSSALASA
ncbi:glutamate--tRNA ligase [Candidatus Peregrinibacteria bacterium]|nr:glutamate--tRNA ligase [Candidatus Peregrinibacteria bacterium]MBI3816190.1 glutamate--tRNA ligase [Candidatus Peregrinibacteria bacterium]